MTSILKKMLTKHFKPPPYLGGVIGVHVCAVVHTSEPKGQKRSGVLLCHSQLYLLGFLTKHRATLSYLPKALGLQREA